MMYRGTKSDGRKQFYAGWSKYRWSRKASLLKKKSDVKGEI